MQRCSTHTRHHRLIRLLNYIPTSLLTCLPAQVTDKSLTLSSPPAGDYVLELVTEIKPQENSRLEGLYKSGGNFCTQCEAEGFRGITFFPDR